MNRRIIVTLLILTLIVNIINLGINLNLNKKQQSKILVLSNNTDECYGLDLVFTSKCLESQLEKFYKYNISQISKNLSLEELKRDGGVCEHFSIWYKERLEQLGGIFIEDDERELVQEKSKFYITNNLFPIKENIAHVNTIVSDNTGYCVLDQINKPICYQFGEYNITIEVKNETI